MKAALLLILTLPAAALDGPPPPAAADLAQCYSWAVEQAESLRVQQEQLKIIEQQYRQALAAALPNVSFNASEKWQDTSGAGGAGSSFFFQSPQPQVNFTLSQPLFSGFREFSAMKAYKHQGEATELQIKRAHTLLYQNTANAFYLVVNLETQLANANMAVDLTTSRIKELRRFEDLGKSRHSDVTLVESQEASQEAQVANLRGQVSVSRQVLAFLTGKDMSQVKLLDRLERVREVAAEDLALGRAYDRTDIRALRKLVEYQEDEVRFAKGSWYPSIGFLANYYAKRQPALEPIHWDAALSASIPLFNGGGQLAAVRQAQASLEQARYNFDFGVRSARSDVHLAYLTLSAVVDGAHAAERAYQKAEETYQLESKEYRLGLVNNLDVMTALNGMIAAKTAFDQIVVQAKIDMLLLKLSYEELP